MCWGMSSLLLHAFASVAPCLAPRPRPRPAIVTPAAPAPPLQVGHALVSTAVARCILGSPAVEKLSIIPRCVAEEKGRGLVSCYSPA